MDQHHEQGSSACSHYPTPRTPFCVAMTADAPLPLESLVTERVGGDRHPQVRQGQDAAIHIIAIRASEWMGVSKKSQRTFTFSGCLIAYEDAKMAYEKQSS